jgi:serine/threonine-protein kinase HipA
MRRAEIYHKDIFAGVLTETESGYEFRYNKAYLDNKDSEPVSLTLPLSEKPYQSKILFPFFDGLIPEGWLLDVALRNTDISSLDRMSLLLLCCKDCIGAVSVVPVNNESNE